MHENITSFSSTFKLKNNEVNFEQLPEAYFIPLKSKHAQFANELPASMHSNKTFQNFQQIGAVGEPKVGFIDNSTSALLTVIKVVRLTSEILLDTRAAEKPCLIYNKYETVECVPPNMNESLTNQQKSNAEENEPKEIKNVIQRPTPSVKTHDTFTAINNAHIITNETGNLSYCRRVSSKLIHRCQQIWHRSNYHNFESIYLASQLSVSFFVFDLQRIMTETIKFCSTPGVLQKHPLLNYRCNISQNSGSTNLEIALSDLDHGGKILKTFESTLSLLNCAYSLKCSDCVLLIPRSTALDNCKLITFEVENLKCLSPEYTCDFYNDPKLVNESFDVLSMPSQSSGLCYILKAIQFVQTKLQERPRHFRRVKSKSAINAERNAHSKTNIPNGVVSFPSLSGKILVQYGYRQFKEIGTKSPVYSSMYSSYTALKCKNLYYNPLKSKTFAHDGQVATFNSFDNTYELINLKRCKEVLRNCSKCKNARTVQHTGSNCRLRACGCLSGGDMGSNRKIDKKLRDCAPSQINICRRPYLTKKFPGGSEKFTYSAKPCVFTSKLSAATAAAPATVTATVHIEALRQGSFNPAEETQVYPGNAVDLSHNVRKTTNNYNSSTETKIVDENLENKEASTKKCNNFKHHSGKQRPVSVSSKEITCVDPEFNVGHVSVNKAKYDIVSSEDVILISSTALTRPVFKYANAGNQATKNTKYFSRGNIDLVINKFLNTDSSRALLHGTTKVHNLKSHSFLSKILRRRCRSADHVRHADRKLTTSFCKHLKNLSGSGSTDEAKNKRTAPKFSLDLLKNVQLDSKLFASKTASIAQPKSVICAKPSAMPFLRNSNQQRLQKLFMKWQENQRERTEIVSTIQAIISEQEHPNSKLRLTGIKNKYGNKSSETCPGLKISDNKSVTQSGNLRSKNRIRISSRSKNSVQKIKEKPEKIQESKRLQIKSEKEMGLLRYLDNRPNWNSRFGISSPCPKSRNNDSQDLRPHVVKSLKEIEKVSQRLYAQSVAHMERRKQRTELGKQELWRIVLAKSNSHVTSTPCIQRRVRGKTFSLSTIRKNLNCENSAQKLTRECQMTQLRDAHDVSGKSHVYIPMTRASTAATSHSQNHIRLNKRLNIPNTQEDSSENAPASFARGRFDGLLLHRRALPLNYQRMMSENDNCVKASNLETAVQSVPIFPLHRKLLHQTLIPGKSFGEKYEDEFQANPLLFRTPNQLIQTCSADCIIQQLQTTKPFEPIGNKPNMCKSNVTSTSMIADTDSKIRKKNLSSLLESMATTYRPLTSTSMSGVIEAIPNIKIKKKIWASNSIKQANISWPTTDIPACAALRNTPDEIKISTGSSENHNRFIRSFNPIISVSEKDKTYLNPFKEIIGTDQNTSLDNSNCDERVHNVIVIGSSPILKMSQQLEKSKSKQQQTRKNVPGVLPASLPVYSKTISSVKTTFVDGIEGAQQKYKECFLVPVRGRESPYRRNNVVSTFQKPDSIPHVITRNLQGKIGAGNTLGTHSFSRKTTNELIYQDRTPAYINSATLISQEKKRQTCSKMIFCEFCQNEKDLINLSAREFAHSIKSPWRTNAHSKASVSCNDDKVFKNQSQCDFNDECIQNVPNKHLLINQMNIHQIKITKSTTNETILPFIHRKSPEIQVRFPQVSNNKVDSNIKNKQGNQNVISAIRSCDNDCYGGQMQRTAIQQKFYPSTNHTLT